MHFRNKHKSYILSEKKPQPCPYHSRLKTLTNSKQTINSHQLPKKSKPQPENQCVTCRLKQKSHSIEEKWSGRFKGLKNFNYYKDEYLIKVQHSRYKTSITDEDIKQRAKMRVRQIYQDEYSEIRQELTLIGRIKARYEMLQRVKKDKRRLRNILKTHIDYETGEED